MAFYLFSSPVLGIILSMDVATTWRATTSFCSWELRATFLPVRVLKIRKRGRRKRLFLRHDGGFEEADVLDPGLDDIAWF